MSNTIGTIKDLDAGREALQGLFSSLDHANSHSSLGSESLSADRLRKLSEKMDEILGDEPARGPTAGDQPSQLLNEDGLPIIDISEPVNEDPQTSSLLRSIPEQEFIPLSLLPPDEKERRRRDRDRILDLLEEEEGSQRLREERDAEEGRKEAVRKRKESAKAELEQLKAARELQRKMGQALVRPSKGVEENRQDDARLEPQVTPPVAKKSVSFADLPVTEADKGYQKTSVRRPEGWGHVTPSRLRAPNRIPLVSAAEAQKHPMKMHVVERHPMAVSASSPSNDADSDDESPSGHLPPHVEKYSSDEIDRTSSSDNERSDEEPLDEGFDCDVAQHHREIALEYHKKRHAIGVVAAKAAATHTIDDYEQHEISNGQPPLSRFRAERMAALYDKSQGPISTSIGQTIVPTSRQKSLRNSVRLGKLESDQLVGGCSGESGSEDEAVREVIQMLKTGNIQNIGPDFNPSSMSAMAPHPSPDSVESMMSVRPSRFKLARGERITESAPSGDNDRGDRDPPQQTVSSVVERNIPRSFPLTPKPSLSYRPPKIR